MSKSMKQLFLIGCGMGSLDLLTNHALQTIKKCEKLFAFDRLAECFSQLNTIEKCTYDALCKNIEDCKGEKIGVLLSGDTVFFSMANTLKERFKANFKVEYINGVSSLQYLCAKMQISIAEVAVVSMHGRSNSLLGSIAYNKHTFALTGGQNNASQLLKDLTALKNIRVTAGENLGTREERIISGDIATLAKEEFSDLTVLMFENPNFVNKHIPLFDDDFVRDKTPMTKQEVRHISVNLLGLQPNSIVMDIGAGSGSVSIEMSRKAYNGIVHAVEKNETAYNLLNINKEKLGALNVLTYFGNALEVIKQLPIPDCVFIGGSSGELKEMLIYLFNKNPKLKYVINAITIETLTTATAVLKELKKPTNICCINSAKNKKAGEYNLMMANNPVYIISGDINAE